MKKLGSVFERLVKQFKAKPVQMYMILGAVGLVTTLAVLFGLGVFRGAEIPQDAFTYLPDREYRLAEEEKQPETLNELLYSKDPKLEDILKNPAIAEEILEAEELVDIVDSRYALSSLRKVEEEVEERSQEEEEEIPKGDLVTLESSPVEEEKPKEKDPSDPTVQAKPYMPEEAPIEEREPVEKDESSKPLDDAAEEIEVKKPGVGKHVRESYSSQKELVAKLSKKLQTLLDKPNYGDWEEIESVINLKAVWQNPGEALLHFVPEADWIPEEGYTITRVIGEEKVVIAERAAAPPTDTKGKFKKHDAEMIASVYESAKYTKEDQAILGMDEAGFRKTVYRMKNIPDQQFLSGEEDFKLMREARITIPDGFDQKLPPSDKLLNNTVTMMGEPENGRFEASVLRSMAERFSVKQDELPNGMQELESDKDKYQQAAETLDARQQLTTLSFVDDEFAKEAGFLIKDDLKDLKLEKDQKITYIIEASGDHRAEVNLNWGKELNLSKPQGFMGYGLDGKVSLRWRNPEGEEGSITSGYFIERKLEGEDSFTQVNEKPVVVSEIMDETGIFFETPIMYQEPLEDGTKAQYRIYSIDIFGRKSEYSDLIDVRVEKVTPPDAPTTAEITLSDNVKSTAEGELKKAIEESVAKNLGKTGIVIPIYNESPDTVRFTLYRAEKEGVGSYSKPEPLANFTYDNPKKGQSLKEGSTEEPEGKGLPKGFYHTQSEFFQIGKLHGSKHLVLNKNEPKAPDLVYFDAKVKKGVTYKYWISAWDSWNNESAWSQSVALGVATEVEPKIPSALAISMMNRELPDLSVRPPGMVFEQNLSKEDVKEQQGEPKRQSRHNTTLIQKADLSQAVVGSFLNENKAPLIISKFFNNIPEQKYIHMILGVTEKDAYADGSVRLRWPAYPGDNLGGYVVYQGEGQGEKLEDIMKFDRTELLELGQWTKLTEKAIEQNQLLIQGIDPRVEKLHIFLVCLEPAPPEKSPETETAEGDGTLDTEKAESIRDEEVHIQDNPEGGHVFLDWDEPEDLQVSHYKVYRSEVENFKKSVDEKKLEWTLISDLNFPSQYTDLVEQSHAHYYYYKVTAVSPWGVESSLGIVDKFRVPSTKPPQTPNLLLPLSKKDGVQVNFSSVQYCSRYEIYRTEIPKASAEQLKDIDVSVLDGIFKTPSASDGFLSNMLSLGLKQSGKKQEIGQVDALSRFKTVNLSLNEDLVNSLSQIDTGKKQESYRNILHEFGPLALSDYRDLSVAMLKLVKWEKIGEIPVEEDTVEQVDPATGLLKPLSFMDSTAKFGSDYLYTVQAWNDDELGSTRPEPVEGTPRRNRPFDPIDGLQGWITSGDFKDVALEWNPPKMEGLTPEECLEDTVGYIVYSSTEKEGNYVQASPLLFKPEWLDVKADPAATNWYKVKVLDTGGYLSDFSEPVLVREPGKVILPRTEILKPEIVTEIPLAPKLALEPTVAVQEGRELKIPFSVTGTEPIEYEVTVDQGGEGIAVPKGRKEIVVPASTPAGVYEITLRAKNKAGEDEKKVVLTLVKEAPKVAPTVTLAERYYETQLGKELRIPFTVSGTEPIRYEIFAMHEVGQDESGIIVPEGKKEILVPEGMKAGKYEVTLTAINDVGKGEAFFYLYILDQSTSGQPPKLILDEKVIVLSQYMGGEVGYTLTGDGHMLYTRYLVNREGVSYTHMLTQDIDGKKLLFSEDLPAGYYTGYLIAENAFGASRQDFTLEVRYKLADEYDESPYLVSFDRNPKPISLSNMERAFDDDYKVQQLESVEKFNPGVIEIPDIKSSDLIVREKYSNKDGTYLHYQLEDLELSRPMVNLKDQPMGYTGTANLVFSSANGTTRKLPVNLINCELSEENGVAKIHTCKIYLDKAHEFEDIGILISSLVIEPGHDGKVSGYVRSPDKTKNLFGDLSGFVFENAHFSGRNALVASVPEGEKAYFSKVGIGPLTLENATQLLIRLDATEEDKDLLTFYGQTSLKAPLETLNNEGITLLNDGLSFDSKGRLSAHLWTDTTESNQFLQLLVPGGSGLKIQASLVYSKGVATDEGWISGRIILPFERADTQGPGVPGIYAGDHPEFNDMDKLLIPETNAEGEAIIPTGDMVNEYLIKFGQKVQKNGLLIVPADPKLQEGCAYAEFKVDQWKGEGFTVDAAKLTPVRVAERSLAVELQRTQAMIVSPTEITIDLDRNSFIPNAAGTQTPKEVEEDFWVGLVVKGGTLELPTSFVQTVDKKPIEFQLAEGEMIYDLNGFNYQTLLANPKGVPAVFGSALGNFEDVLVFDCLLDLYANRVNLEINAEVGLELFNNNRVKVKLYTNKENNEDGKAGEFLCSVVPTEIQDFVGTKTKLIVDGGFVEKQGMRIGGSIELATEELQFKDTMKFSSLVIPSKKTSTNKANNAKKIHGWATLDRAVPVHMQGFNLAIREINFEYMSEVDHPYVPTRLSLWGAVMLSEDIPLGEETTDRIAMDTLETAKLHDPKLIYDDSFSVLDTSFDECIDVKGVLVPKLLEEPSARGRRTLSGLRQQSSDIDTEDVKEKLGKIQQGLIEFETENLELGFLGTLGELPIDTITRFGYDVDNSRCYFSVGLMKKEGDLNVGIGDMKKFSGLITSNMIVERDEDNHLVFPEDKEAMKELVHNMEVDRTKDGRFAAAMKGTLSIGQVCEVRDLYFGFDKGPMVEASGGLYLPLDVDVMLNPSADGFREVGTIVILYSHPERYFSFSMTLNEIEIASVRVSGSLGFEFSPKLFGVYLGYPETLVANVSIYHIGLGLGFRLDDDGRNIIKAKAEFGFERKVEVAIVYLHGYVYAGADGGYYENIDVDDDGIPDGDKFILTLYLTGGLKGGVRVFGKNFDFISFYLDARGTIESTPRPGKDLWTLRCSAKVTYSRRIYFVKISGSVKASFDKNLN